MSKVYCAKSPLFFPLESFETRLDKFSNSHDKFSNVSRIEDRELRFEYQASRDCQLTFERYCMSFTCLSFSEHFLDPQSEVMLENRGKVFCASTAHHTYFCTFFHFIPANFEIGRSSAGELKPLHKLLYGRDGRVCFRNQYLCLNFILSLFRCIFPTTHTVFFLKCFETFVTIVY